MLSNLKNKILVFKIPESMMYIYGVNKILEIIDKLESLLVWWSDLL